ncbi:hypothetical protein OCO53_02415 [Peribacillus frigoritolerans]|uniref:hypothetical protein n=1 Tax=Peribacillus frigoritolerans TaxID=450367 RepID=UPI0021D1FBFC|nr:hypothetical protein [Peribacillus frigoritolerans]MCU6599325.1 hypothetical protein [Peribacillus frigoritolerans]
METYQRKMNYNRDEYRKLRWKQHRIQVTGLFDAVFSKKAFVDKVAIVGAGNCDDLDIEYLATKCNSIYLFDIDMESMEKGTANFPERTREKIQLIEIDVTGLDKVDFDHHLSSMLNRGETAKGIIRYLKDTENRLGQLSDRVFANYYNDFDIVAISAIYTQLFYNWAMELLSDHVNQYQKKDVEEMKNGILDVRDEIVRTVNHSISKCTKQNGFCITWTDILKIEPEYMDTINEGLNAIFALASNVGYGAALIGVKTFIEKLDKNELTLRYWPWDFQENKQYLTIGIIGRNNGL